MHNCLTMPPMIIPYFSVILIVAFYRKSYKLSNEPHKTAYDAKY